MTFLFQLELAVTHPQAQQSLERIASEHLPGGLAHVAAYADLQWLVAYGWADRNALVVLLTELFAQLAANSPKSTTQFHPFAGLIHRLTLISSKPEQSAAALEALRWICRRVGERVHVPIILVDQAGRSVIRRSASIVLGDGFDKMAERLKSVPPEFGPAHVHPRAGAMLGSVAIARWEGVVDLDQQNLVVAEKLARKLCERDGGVPGLQAIAREGAKEHHARILLWSDQPQADLLRLAEKRLQALAEIYNVNPSKIKTLGLTADEVAALKPLVPVS